MAHTARSRWETVIPSGILGIRDRQYVRTPVLPRMRNPGSMRQRPDEIVRSMQYAAMVLLKFAPQ